MYVASKQSVPCSSIYLSISKKLIIIIIDAMLILKESYLFRYYYVTLRSVATNNYFWTARFQL